VRTGNDGEREDGRTSERENGRTGGRATSGFRARTPDVWAVVPAGGSGTRLWPLSRAARPKFLLPLLGRRSLLQQTADRLGAVAAPERTFVVCGPAHAAAVARQLPELPEENVLVEPSPKGSGPAIGLAAALIARQDPEAVMGSFAADHDVQDEAAFVRAVEIAVAAARRGYLVTIGLKPTRAETGYGYIERTEDAVVTTEVGSAYRATRFHEKPDQSRAEEYVASGRFLWNASMFVWRAQTLLDELARLQPDLHAGLTRIADCWDDPSVETVLAEVWAELPESTIDQGVMERAAKVAVVPAEMGWSDVGDWHGLGELIEGDALGNSVRGDLLLHESRNCVVWSETVRVVALVGLEDVVVVDTPDALLVADRRRTQEVRKVVDHLKAQRRDALR
jgi:mannose-1-phosphate guanylyltransferase